MSDSTSFLTEICNWKMNSICDLICFAEKRDVTLNHGNMYSVLQVTKSWMGTGNKAKLHQLTSLPGHSQLLTPISKPSPWGGI